MGAQLLIGCCAALVGGKRTLTALHAAILSTAAKAFEAAKTAQAPVLIAGGISNSTAPLVEAVAQRYAGIEVRERPEAAGGDCGPARSCWDKTR